MLVEEELLDLLGRPGGVEDSANSKDRLTKVAQQIVKYSESFLNPLERQNKTIGKARIFDTQQKKKHKTSSFEKKHQKNIGFKAFF